MMNGWGGGMTASWVFMGVFWILLMVVIAWLVTQVLPARKAPAELPDRPQDDSPETILARRLARGEIDPETYDELRGKLHEPRVPIGGPAS